MNDNIGLKQAHLALFREISSVFVFEEFWLISQHQQIGKKTHMF
jgi:hypothetical protein